MKHSHSFSGPVTPVEYFIHQEGDLHCSHEFQGKYLGQGYWGQECRLCGRLIEEKIPGYNCPEEEK